MEQSPRFFIGIDPTAGRTPYTWAVLDADSRLVALAGGELEDALEVVNGMPSILVAVNAPAHPNRGLVRFRLAAENSSVHLRGADMRLGEYILKGRGISIPPTPARKESCAAWIQMGFHLHEKLEGSGSVLYPGGEAPYQRMETNPHAVFCALLGQLPLPKPTLEGRLQRQLALHNQGADIGDPMDFFEEITRHKILQGTLPWENIYTPEELDALAGAFTAWLVVNRPEECIRVGDREEGEIFLPVRALKEMYSAAG